MDEHQPILDIFTSFREVNQAFYHTAHYDEQGITPIQYLVMKTLSAQPLIGLSELSECLHMGNSSCSGVVDRMVKAGWVTRERPETDRRSIALKLTPDGEELWLKVHEHRVNRLSPLLELPEEDRRSLLRIHGQIVQILQRVREESNNHE